MSTYPRNGNNDPIVLQCVECVKNTIVNISEAEGFVFLQSSTRNIPEANFVSKGNSLCEKHFLDQLLKNK